MTPGLPSETRIFSFPRLDEVEQIDSPVRTKTRCLVAVPEAWRFPSTLMPTRSLSGPMRGVDAVRALCLATMLYRNRAEEARGKL